MIVPHLNEVAPAPLNSKTFPRIVESNWICCHQKRDPSTPATYLTKLQPAFKPESQLVSIDKYGDQAEAVMHELARSVRGEVRFDPASRSLYASDLSVYRHVPIGVVVPRDADDVIATVDCCRRHQVPILGRG